METTPPQDETTQPGATAPTGAVPAGADAAAAQEGAAAPAEEGAATAAEDAATAPAEDAAAAPAEDAAAALAEDAATAPAEDAATAASTEEEAAAAEPAEEEDPNAVLGLIFDLDGTLIDSRDDIAASVNVVLESMEREPQSPDAIGHYIGDGVRKLLARALDTDDEEVLDNAMNTFFDHYSEHYLDKTTAHPGAREILEHFKDKQCAVVSNKPEAFCRAILAALELDSNLVAIVGGDTLGVHKPDPQPFEVALDLMGVDPARAVVIGDGLNDIEGGRAVGTRTCAVTYGLTDAETLAAAGPDFTVDQLSDLVGLFS